MKKPPLCLLGFHRWGAYLIDHLYYGGAKVSVTIQHCDRCPAVHGTRQPEADLEFTQWLRDLGLPF